MSIERTEVRYDVDDRQVRTSVTEIDRELDQLQNKAQETVRQARQARAEASGMGGGSVIGRRARGEFRGALTQNLSAGGLMRAGLRTGGITRSIGPLIAIHAAGQGLGALASMRDVVADARSRGASGDEILRELGGGAARSIVDRVGSMTGLRQLGTSIFAMASGRRMDEAQQDVQSMLDDAFSTREELARRRQAQEAEKERQDAEIEALREQGMGALKASLPQGVRLKTAADVQRFRAAMKYDRRPDGISNMEALEAHLKEQRAQREALAESEGR